MNKELHRHDISDSSWSLISPHLPGKAGDWGRVAKENRLFISAVTWVFRTGAPWRDLPSEYGNWNALSVNTGRGHSAALFEVCCTS